MTPDPFVSHAKGSPAKRMLAIKAMGTKIASGQSKFQQTAGNNGAASLSIKVKH